MQLLFSKNLFLGGVPPSYPLRGFGSRRDLRIRVAWVVLDLCAKFQPPSSILASSTHCLSLVKKICQYAPPPYINLLNIQKLHKIEIDFVICTLKELYTS